MARRLSWRDDEPVAMSRHLRAAWANSLVFITVAIALLSKSPAPDIVYKSF